MLIWRLAFRNLFRHKSRLTLNLILLLGSFCAIVVFNGFKFNVLETMKDILIDTNYGHFQVASDKLWENKPVDQLTDKMISNPSQIVQKLSAIQEIEFITPRVAFYGLLNSKEKSISAQFVGYNFEIEKNMQKRLNLESGSVLNGPKQVVIGSGLHKISKINLHDELTLVSPTLDGSVNAIELTLNGVFKSGFTQIDNSTAYISLSDAQKILGSDHVDRLLIRLKNESSIPDAKIKIKEQIEGSGLVVKDWREQSEIYEQVEDFYNFQSVIIEGIFILLMILNIINTVNMTVFERLGEIGTLRALGDNERDIQVLFLAESFMLGILSIAIGWPLSYFLMLAGSNLGIEITLPLASMPFPLNFATVPKAFIDATLIVLGSIMLASIWPARKGARVAIVTALRAKV